MENRKLFWTIFLSIILVLRIFISLASKNYDFLWFCVVNLAILIIAIPTENLLLYSSVLVSSFIPEIFRTLDVIAYSLTGKLIFNVANYIPNMSSFSFIISFYHLFLVIIPGYYILKNKKFDSRAWIFSSLLFLAASIATLIFTDSNANCAKDFCHLGVFNAFYALKFSFIPFPVFHTVLVTILVFLPSNYLVRRFLNRKKSSRE